MEPRKGGCLCGRIRYQAKAPPIRVTICHCRFCQRATGSDRMIEPIFEAGDFSVVDGAPRTYDLVSEGSGKVVHIHFCPDCGSKLFLSFERWGGIVGVYAGTFDDPDWFEITPANSKQIFVEEAQRLAVILPHISAFGQHATLNDGTALEPIVHDRPVIVGTGAPRAAVQGRDTRR